MRSIVVLLALSTLAGCGGNPNRPDPPPPPPVNLTGTWMGTIRSTVISGAFANIVLTLTQSGNSISGTITCSRGNTSCLFSSGEVSGTVSGSSVTGGVTFTGGSCQAFNGTVSGDSMSGSYACSAPLGSDSGTWSVTRGSSTPCTYSLSSTSTSFPPAGGTGLVSVTAPMGCGWSAASNAGWITITSGTSGSGNGQVAFTVAANSGSARTGTLTVAQQTLTIRQEAASSARRDFSGNYTLEIVAAARCAWPAPTQRLRVVALPDYFDGNLGFGTFEVPGDPLGMLFTYTYSYSPGYSAMTISTAGDLVWDGGSVVGLVGRAEGAAPVAGADARPEIIRATLEAGMSLTTGGRYYECAGAGVGTLSLRIR